MVIMVVERGQGHAGRPIVGGLIFGLLPVRAASSPSAGGPMDRLRGAVLVLILFVMPRGIVPAVHDRFTRRAMPMRMYRCRERP